MAKLYIFGIGGTGSRVLKSLTMLLASGVDCDVDTIVPIIIDRDKGNGDFTRTDTLIKHYVAVNKFAPKANKNAGIKNRFFNTEIKLLGNDLLLKLDDDTKKFSEFIGLSTQTEQNKSLSKMLFSKNTLEMDTEYGFKGNPNIGSVVLNQFDDKNIFKAFASDFQDGDKIFIISSIFGGTGASGFPLLRKMLQTPNLKDASGAELPNWGLINAAPIGAISVLPYFNVDKKDNVDSDTFNDKTRAALSYYQTENGKLDALYYIADTNRKAYKYAEGGKEQENDAHFVELSAAMSILDFVNEDKKAVNFQKDNNGNRKTTYKEFGINADVPEITFDNLAAETQKLLVNPLSRFVLFAKYMGYSIVKKQEGGKDKYVAEKVAKQDIFSQENNYQPYAHGRFTGDFRNNIADLETVQRLFFDWLQELTQQSRKFKPFNLTTSNAFDFVNGKVSLFTKQDFRYKNWSAVDNELNRQIAHTKSVKDNQGKFIELFYRAMEALINQTTQSSGNGSAKYIFRLQNEGDFGLVNTIEHWGVSDIYGDKQRNAIKSSNEKSDNQPTSIPSPFARIALAKTAFGEVATLGDKALKAYQKIVSDTLDIAEIFFTLDKHKNKVEVIEWRKNEDLKALENHKILHKTLNTFLENDADTYNFNKMKTVFILKYTKTGEIIGATSPCTLFFSSANNLHNVDIQLNAAHKAFDGIVPLHERGWGFQKYLYAWFAANNETRQINDKPVSIFTEIENYLNAQKQISIGKGKNAKDFVISDTSAELSKYKQLRSPDVEILGKAYYSSQEIGKENLTTDDLLEDKIIRLPYEMQKDSFFDGNLSDCKHSYLLPVKDIFFKHYTVADLKKFIKINSSGDVAEVVLKIDEKEYRKQYTKSSGTIVESNFDFALFPNIKFTQDETAYYRFGLIAEFDEAAKYGLSYFGDNDRKMPLEAVVRNARNRNYAQCRHYYLEKTSFNYLQISYDNAQGIIVPSFERTDNGSKQVTFAVDFGTTNTHIEYTIDNNPAKALEIASLEKQINVLSKEEDRTVKYDLIFDADLMPEFIGAGTEFGFPMRTALAEASNTDWLSAVYAMANANLPFDYEKRPTYDYNTITPNLKWSNDMDNMKRVKTYIESLFLILRNKVILKDGDLKSTKIVWFYPISMTQNRFNLFKIEWENAYKKYFDLNTENIIPMTESVAPYEFYKNSVSNASNMVTVDIGGGTTDIVIAQRGEVKHITSFRFAANSIFGDGYATNQHGSSQNGIVRQFKTKIYDVLQANNMDDLMNVYKEMDDKNISAEIASFLFSLKSNKTLLDKNIADNADFNLLLQADGTQKIIFAFFYTAIIYHLAHILKVQNLPMPRHITFSGNGSKVIRILSNDTKTLEKFTKKIFEKIAVKDFNGELTIKHNAETPKEATCKGGISNPETEDYDSIINKKVILKGSDNQTFVSKETYGNINSEDLIQKTTKEAKRFIDFVLGLNSDFSFKNNFGVDTESVNIAKSECEKDLETFTRNGLEQKLKEVAKEDPIEETFFFYPLTGMLYELSNKIFESKNNE